MLQTVLDAIREAAVEMAETEVQHIDLYDEGYDEAFDKAFDKAVISLLEDINLEYAYLTK